MTLQKLRKPAALVIVVAVALIGLIVVRSRQDAEATSAAPTATTAEVADQPVTMADVITVAKEVRDHLDKNVNDYTLQFSKQDRDTTGVLQPEETLFLKVKSPTLDNGEPKALCVYLKALAPDSKKGQEVIWSKDLFEGKLCAHLTGIMGMKRMYVEPTSIFAMVGQRHPISEIGMGNLVESVIKRGERIRDNPEISIARIDDHQHGDVIVDLYQITNNEPSGGEDDFSYSEVGFDRERNLLLIFRTFGWPETDGGDPVLLESYSYQDVKTNVGLTDEDFDPDNPNYEFPKF